LWNIIIQGIDVKSVA